MGYWKHVIIIFVLIALVGCVSTTQEGGEDITETLPEDIMKTERGEEIMVTNGVKHIVPLEKIVSGGPPKDGIPSIDNPKFISVENGNKFLKDDELVMGIFLDDVARAYPLQILVWHEIVNDKIKGKPVLITYCPLCGSGIAFERTINGEEVEFGVSGKLYNSDLVMYDRKTETYWDQITGRAIVGELVGMRLKKLPLDTTTWGDWKGLHPDTQVLSKDTGFFRDYGRDPYGDYDTSSRIIFPVDKKDDRLHPKAIVYGIEIGDSFKAYPEEELKKVGRIEENFAGIDIRVERDSTGIVTVTNMDTGEIIDKVRTFWFAWVAFHPETQLFLSS